MSTVRESQRSVLILFPEIVVGAIVGGAAVCRVIDLNWWLILVPFAGAVIGGGISAWRVNRSLSVADAAHLRVRAFHWSVYLLVGGPLIGFIFAAVNIPAGAARPFHLAVFSIVGLVAGTIFASSLATAALFIKRRSAPNSESVQGDPPTADNV
jgi:hypothetical protein